MTTFRTIRNHRTSAFAVVPITLAAAALGMLETQLSPWDPDTRHRPAQVQTGRLAGRRHRLPRLRRPAVPLVPPDWPDEARGYPGYADQVSSTSTESHQRLDTTSVALGALGGITLGGAGLGLTLAVQRRRDTTTGSAA